jgi:hypothetical protein
MISKPHVVSEHILKAARVVAGTQR